MSIGVFYGRMNPFTRGHASVLKEIRKNGRTPIIIVSHTKNGNKNPLNANQKINIIKNSLATMGGQNNVKVMATSSSMPSIFSTLEILKINNPNIQVYLGSNRIPTLGKSLQKSGYLVKQFGKTRTNNGVSGTRSRAAARAGNTATFQSMMTPGLTPKTLNSIMKTIRNQTSPKKKRSPPKSGIKRKMT
jgi:cytidyltransferase-like protein